MTDSTPQTPIDVDTVSTQTVETLMNMITEAHNLYVEEHFNEIELVNPTDPLLELKPFSLVNQTDSFIMVLLRFWIFYVLLGKAAFFQTPTYSIPVTTFQDARTFYPQVTLYFKEDHATVEPGFAPVYGEITYRIVKTPLVDINQSFATQLGTQIKEQFGLTRFSWSKGWLKVTYLDKARGYDFRLYVSSEGEAIRIITAILELQGDGIDETLIVQNRSSKTFPAVPGEQFLYGKERRKPRQRPVATVYFYRATLAIHGVPDAIVLYDRSGRSRNPLVR